MSEEKQSTRNRLLEKRRTKRAGAPPAVEAGEASESPKRARRTTRKK